jgi:pimeloyl-ACP methyl ester carboxylesterase
MPGNEFSCPLTEGVVRGKIFESGQPVRLLFLPDAGDSIEAFEEVWKSSIVARYDILAFDPLGFGASDRPTEAPYGLDHSVRVLQRVLESSKRFGDWYVVASGYSFLVALALSVRWPGVLASIVGFGLGRLDTRVVEGNGMFSLDRHEFTVRELPVWIGRCKADRRSLRGIDEAATFALFPILKELREMKLGAKISELSAASRSRQAFLVTEDERDFAEVLLSGAPGIGLSSIPGTRDDLLVENPTHSLSAMQARLQIIL